MNFNPTGAPGRHTRARAVKRTFRRLKSQLFRGLDIIVSAVVICFLAPVFAVLAIASWSQGRDAATMDGWMARFGLGQLPQLFQVFAGRMSLFD